MIFAGLNDLFSPLCSLFPLPCLPFFLPFYKLFLSFFLSSNNYFVIFLPSNSTLFIFVYSVFCGMPIPYPKREFITDDDNDDKSAKVISIFVDQNRLFTNSYRHKYIVIISFKSPTWHLALYQLFLSFHNICYFTNILRLLFQI